MITLSLRTVAAVLGLALVVAAPSAAAQNHNVRLTMTYGSSTYGSGTWTYTLTNAGSVSIPAPTSVALTNVFPAGMHVLRKPVGNPTCDAVLEGGAVSVYNSVAAPVTLHCTFTTGEVAPNGVIASMHAISFHGTPLQNCASAVLLAANGTVAPETNTADNTACWPNAIHQLDLEASASGGSWGNQVSRTWLLGGRNAGQVAIPVGSRLEVTAQMPAGPRLYSMVATPGWSCVDPTGGNVPVTDTERVFSNGPNQGFLIRCSTILTAPLLPGALIQHFDRYRAVQVVTINAQATGLEATLTFSLPRTDQSYAPVVDANMANNIVTVP